MAVLNTTKAAPFGAIAIWRAIRATEAVKNSLISWHVKRNTYKELSALSVRELDDIGLTRGDVERLNAGFFRF